MIRDNKDSVYCDAQMPMAQGRELSRLVAELRTSGDYPGLDSVFEELQHELDTSIKFGDLQLAGVGVFGRRPH